MSKIKLFPLLAAFLLGAAALLPSCNKTDVTPKTQTSLSIPSEDCNFSVTSDFTESKNVRLTAGGSWTATADQSWISVSPSSGTEGTMIVTIRVKEANETYDNRTATVTFTCGSEQKKVTLTQGMKYVLTITSGTTVESDAHSLSFSKDGGSIDIGISSNTEYKVSSTVDWITAVATKGATASKVSVTVKANDTGLPRKGFISISQTGGATISVAVHEDGSIKAYFVHTPLIMRFTATWCGYCPYMEKAISACLEQNPNLFNEIALYSTNGLPDSSTPKEPDVALSNQYGISGVPSAVLDGRMSFGVVSFNKQDNIDLIVKACKEETTSYPALAGIALTTSVSGTTLSVTASVKTLVTIGSQKLCVAVTEDGIKADQTSYDPADNGLIQDFLHSHVIRQYLSAIKGDAIESTPASDAVKTYKFEAPSGVNLSNCHVIAYVFTSYGTYDSSIHGISDASYYADENSKTFIANSVSCKAGESIDFKYE